MSDPPRVDRVRALATRLVERVGGIPAVRTLLATLEVYDGAGGGLVANGLAYSGLVALVPGALLVASVIGLVITDPAMQQRLVAAIGDAVPPLADVVESALETVAQGAVPTTIVALIGLLWGSSRFYAALDYAFSKVFHAERRRNEIVRTLRGLLVTFLLVALPIAALIVGWFASWLLDLAADGGTIEGVLRTLLQLATPIGSFVLFVAVVTLVYRFVPVERVSWRAIGPPAALVGVGLAGFAQLFTFIGPRLAGFAVLFGAFVAIFALLAWLAISFNMLLLGASWTRVRALAIAQPDARPALDEPGSDSRTGPG
jgi:membrane protein